MVAACKVRAFDIGGSDGSLIQNMVYSKIKTVSVVSYCGAESTIAIGVAHGSANFPVGIRIGSVVEVAAQNHVAILASEQFADVLSLLRTVAHSISNLGVKMLFEVFSQSLGLASGFGHVFPFDGVLVQFLVVVRQPD